MNDQNQSTSKLFYERGPKYFDFFYFCNQDQTLPTNLNEFMNIPTPIFIYMIQPIYSTNWIG